jgi:hypothetical protein
MKNRSSPQKSVPPIIIDLGDSDYATVYDVLVSPDDEMEIKYRYTGNKNPMQVEKLLYGALLDAMDKAREKLNDR